MGRKSIQLFAIESSTPRPLRVPPGAQKVHDLFHDLPVGVYTVLCTFEHNKFLHLNDHIDRINNSIARLGWSYELNRDALCFSLDRICTDFPAADSLVRIDVLATPSDRLESSSRLLIALAPFDKTPEEVYNRGVKLGIVRDLTRERPAVKQADFVRRRQKFLSQRPGVYELLLVSRSGRLLEGTTSNFYAVKNGRLHTAGHGVLEGIARKIILGLASDLTIPLDLNAIHESEIQDLDEAAISSTSRGLIPVVRIDDETIAGGQPGSITRRLLSAYWAYVAQNIKPAV